MAAYLIANIELTDQAAYAEYNRRTPAVVTTYDGRFLARGGTAEMLEGEIRPHRMAILEFPDMARLKAFYRSPEYQALAAIRRRASRASFIAVEGV